LIRDHVDKVPKLLKSTEQGVSHIDLTLIFKKFMEVDGKGQEL